MEAVDTGGSGGQENGRRFRKSLKRSPPKVYSLSAGPWFESRWGHFFRFNHQQWFALGRSRNRLRYPPMNDRFSAPAVQQQHANVMADSDPSRSSRQTPWVYTEPSQVVVQTFLFSHFEHCVVSLLMIH